MAGDAERGTGTVDVELLKSRLRSSSTSGRIFRLEKLSDEISDRGKPPGKLGATMARERLFLNRAL